MQSTLPLVRNDAYAKFKMRASKNVKETTESVMLQPSAHPFDVFGSLSAAPLYNLLPSLHDFFTMIGYHFVWFCDSKSLLMDRLNMADPNQKILYDGPAFFRKDRLRVELHAVNSVFLVLHSHDDAIVQASGCYREHFR